jgi:hypothetical protein
LESSRKPASATNSLWISIFFLSSSWLFLFPAFAPRNWWAGLASIAAGAVFAILAFRGTSRGKLDWRYAIFLVPLVVSFFFVPFPYSLGPMLLAAGIALGCLVGWATFAAAGLSLSGVIMTAQAAVLPLYSSVASRYHTAGIAAPATNLLLRVLGVQTAVRGDLVFVQGTRHVNAFAVTWEKLALLSIVEVLIGGAVLLLLTWSKSSKARSFLYLFLVVVAYAVVREVFLTLVFMDNENLRLFWRPVITWLSLVPLFVVLARLFPVAGLPRLRSFALDRRFWLVGATAFLAAALLVGAWGYQDPGVRKQGRVLVDEKHSNWEWTTEKYDTSWYGEKSGYNYYSLYTYLDSFYKADRNFKQLTPEVLAGYDVLMVKTPTEPFSDQEVDAIQEFVRNGGGLFLVGDHTNVFGTSSFINPIAGRFGLKYNYDATYELAKGQLTEYSRPQVMPHPIVQRMPQLLFGTSCSLEVPPDARVVIAGSQMKSNYADYSEKNFFPKELDTPRTQFGSFVQAAAVTQGRGRVFAFTDSTIFSNFWMFMPGKPELALGAMGWLNRKNGMLNVSFVLLALGLAFLALTGYLAVKERSFRTVITIVCAGLLAFALVTPAVAAMNRSTYGPARERKPVTRVNFDQRDSDFSVPSTFKEFKAVPQRQFSTFYVWNQRLGYVPAISTSLEDATKTGDLVVLINPVKSLTDREKQNIVGFAKRGGKVLVMDSADRKSTANEVLELFGMKFAPDPVGKNAVSFTGTEVMTTARACSVEGGRALLSTHGGKPIFSVARVGKGLVGAFSDSFVFSDSQLGGAQSIPDQSQIQTSALEFWMLRTMMGQPQD